MPNPTVEIKLEDILVSIQKDLKEIRDDLTDLKVSQAEIKGEIKTLDEKLSGQIKTLDEKVTGIGKRLENQEFLNRGILAALIVALIAGAAKLFGWLPIS
jgi:predicted  nucleic acid-binding Zn-ribbon protein